MATVQSQLESPPRRRSRKKLIGIAVLALIAALVLPPLKTVNGFRNRLEVAMSAAVGRKVKVKNVHLRLLPQPGFELSKFAIQDDPAVSAEPLLRADSVNANLRVASLWHGRIEIARLDLKEPSLNLVRTANGEWNLEQLLLHAYQVPLAPTGRAESEARPRFPYIDAEGGRINIKIGAEKKVYALGDADFSLWLASENEWDMRLAGRPMRTDFDFGDTGTLRVTGSFTRSPTPRQTPLKLTINLMGAQLGQMSQFIYGRDRGWRGGMDLEAELTGSPSALNVSGRISVRDFHRYDVSIPGTLDFEITCGAAYTGTSATVPSPGILEGSCSLPRDRGVLNLSGFYHTETHDAEATAVAAAFPVSGALDFARHMKRGIAQDLTGDGAINGRITLSNGQSESAGGGSTASHDAATITAQTVLRSRELKPELNLGVLVFTLEQPQTPAAKRARTRSHEASEATAFSLLPASVGLGGATPVTLSATTDHAGYQVAMKGEADLARIRAFVGALGLPVAQLQGEGRVHVDLHFDGGWAGFAAPSESGSVRLEPAPVLARQR